MAEETLNQLIDMGHESIVERIREIAKEQNEPFDLNNTVNSSMTWSQTSEGDPFWNMICEGYFDEFYKKYPDHVGPPMDPDYVIHLTRKSIHLLRNQYPHLTEHAKIGHNFQGVLDEADTHQ